MNKNFGFFTGLNGLCGFEEVKKGFVSIWEQSPQISKFNIQPDKELWSCRTVSLNYTGAWPCVMGITITGA